VARSRGGGSAPTSSPPARPCPSTRITNPPASGEIGGDSPRVPGPPPSRPLPYRGRNSPPAAGGTLRSSAPLPPRKPLRSSSLFGRRRPRPGSRPRRACRRTLLALGWRGLERRSVPCHLGKHPVACSGHFVGLLLAAAVRD